LSRCEALVVNDSSALDRSRRLKRLIGMRNEWEADLHARSSWLAIKHKEIVVIDIGYDRHASEVLELMLQRKDGAVAGELDHFDVLVGNSHR